MSSLKHVLLNEYGAFADKRIKHLERGHLFIVDDRTPRDIGADKSLYSYFCLMFADVINDDEVKVLLRGNVPISRKVEQWIKHSGAKYSEGQETSLEISLRRGQQGLLRELAESVRAITAPGAPRYDIASYKFVCPRTASSLDRLTSVLDKAWSEVEGL